MNRNRIGIPNDVHNTCNLANQNSCICSYYKLESNGGTLTRTATLTNRLKSN